MTLPQSAMIMAAGFGERMRPLTLETPKPLLRLGDRTLIDYALDHLAAAGIPNIVVNLHYKGETIREHVAARSPQVRFSPEETILETGGGAKRALPLLGDQPFFVLNADTVWIDGATPALERLAAMWDATKMDVLLLLEPTKPGEAGDYALDQAGRLQYRPDGKTAPFSFRALSVNNPRLIATTPGDRFSLKNVWDCAEAKGRLFGLVHDGGMVHLSTPEDLAAANRSLKALSNQATAQISPLPHGRGRLPVPKAKGDG